jgi:hypothetical protein
LLKVYLNKGSERKLIAKEIVLVTKEYDNIKLADINFKEITLDNVKLSKINAMNSELILESQA